MAGRKIYDNNPYYNYDINAFRKAAMQDPKFVLGEIIGGALANAYANNYNNRGIEKAVDKALQSFGTGDAANEQAALQDLQQNYAQQPGVSVGDMDALNSIRQENGLSALQLSGPTISAGTIPQTETPEQAIERIAQTPGAAIVAREQAARKLGNFDMNTALMQARQQMLKDGRTPYQVEQAMQQLQPYFQNMQDEEYRINAERIMAELGATDENGKRVLSDNDYKQRIIELSQLGDIGKAAANVYGRDIVTGREQWNAQQQAERDDRRFAAQRNNIITRGQYNNTRGTRSAAAFTANMKQLESIGKRLDAIEQKRIAMQAGGPPVTQAETLYYNTMKDAYDAAMLVNDASALGLSVQQDGAAGNGRSNEVPGRSANRDEYLKKFAEQLVKNNGGYFDENAAKVLRKEYGIDPNNNDPDEPVNKLMREKYGYAPSVGNQRSKRGPGLFVEANQTNQSAPANTSAPEPWWNQKVDFSNVGKEASRMAKEDEERKKGNRQYAGTGYWNRQ